MAVRDYSSTDSYSSQADSASSKKSEQKKVPQDWVMIAGQLDELESDRDIGAMRMMLKLQQQVMEMNQDELLAALDEISLKNLKKLWSRYLLDH